MDEPPIVTEKKKDVELVKQQISMTVLIGAVILLTLGYLIGRGHC